MTAPVSDEDLMLRYRDGDAAAFEELYRRHKGGVYRYLLRGLNDRAVAEELLQEVWLSLIRSRSGYAVRAKFTTYLYHIAHTRLIDHHRRRRSEHEVDIDEAAGASLEDLAPDPSGGPEQIVAARQQALRVVDALQALPAAQREAYLLFEEAGLNVEEIAGVTGVDREAAKSRLRYAFNKLRAALKGI